MKPYSYDLRIRIFSYSLTHSVKETAEVFNVSTNTGYLIKRLFIETGDFQPRSRPSQYPHLISPDGELYIKLIVFSNPDITLRELCEEYESVYHVRVSISTMHNTLKKLGFVYKNKVYHDPGKTREGAQQLKKDYDQALSRIPAENRVYLDETSGYLNMSGPRGWSKKGRNQHPVEAKPAHSEVHLNPLAIVSKSGVKADFHYLKNLNRKLFITYLEEQILPPWNPEKVLIMDRHPVPSAQAVQDFLHTHHLRYLYLPPYSPELNPLEEIFAQVKQFIKRIKPRKLKDLLERIQQGFEKITLDTIQRYFKHAESFSNLSINVN